MKVLVRRHKVLRGELRVDADDADTSVATQRPVAPRADGPTLTRREQDVVQLIGRGYTNKVIATRLGLSEFTVRNYLTRIREKLAVSNRVGLALYAVRSIVEK